MLIAVVGRFEVEIALCGNAACCRWIFAVILEMFGYFNVNARVVQCIGYESVVVVDVKDGPGKAPARH